jgi:hypothetical protein
LLQHGALVPVDVLVGEAVAAQGNDGDHWDFEFPVRGRERGQAGRDSCEKGSGQWVSGLEEDLQPFDGAVVGQFENEFVDDAVDADGARDEG